MYKVYKYNPAVSGYHILVVTFVEPKDGIDYADKMTGNKGYTYYSIWED